MKITRTKTLVGVALTCLALAGPSTISAQTTNVLSDFASDLGVMAPYQTNLWGFVNDTPTPTSITWSSSVGNPAGSMKVVLDWTPTAGEWDWTDAKTQVEPWSSNAPPIEEVIDLSKFDSIDFDLFVDTSVSQTNTGGNYGGLQVIAQTWGGWGNNPTNIDTGYHNLGSATLPTDGNWHHFSIGTAVWPYTLSRLTLNHYIQQNTVQPGPLHVEVYVDNVAFVAAGVAPSLTYSKAKRGMNIWTTGAQYDRNMIRSVQPGSKYLMWPDSVPASYGFTIAPEGFPLNVEGYTNFSVSMMIVAANPAVGEAAPDWNQADVIWMQLGMATNQPSYAYWTFHWKTNSANGNGQYYEGTNQITITNPSPIGKWVLRFNDNTSVTMTAPNGASTNFVMGVHTNVPDISDAFRVTAGTVYWGIFVNDTNTAGLGMVLGDAWVNGNALNNISNNWAATTSTDWTNNFEIVAGAPYAFVDAASSWWVNWTLPDGGYALQTNAVGVGFHDSWSTNHNLPAAAVIGGKKAVLVKPGMLPASSQLFYRLSKPGY